MSKVLRQKLIYLREAFSNHIPGHEGSSWQKGWGGTLQKSYLLYSSRTSARGRSRGKSQVCKCRFSTLPLHFTTETLRNHVSWEREGPTRRQGLGERGHLPGVGSLRDPGALSDQLQIGASDRILETGRIDGSQKGLNLGAVATRDFAFIKKKKKKSWASLGQRDCLHSVHWVRHTGQRDPKNVSPKLVTLKQGGPLE